jgi:hypothetical protein
MKLPDICPPEKKEKDIVRVNSIQIESIDKLRDFCPPERKQPLPDLLVGRNAAYISILGGFLHGLNISLPHMDLPCTEKPDTVK